MARVKGIDYTPKRFVDAEAALVGDEKAESCYVTDTGPLNPVIPACCNDLWNPPHAVRVPCG